jgi:two-component system cell cycle sensor histidine kinase/response regulator CckA
MEPEAPFASGFHDDDPGTKSSGRVRQQLDIKPRSWVIVAEDDTVLRALLAETLREAGFQILTAANGLEALKLYAENAGKVWLVVADLIMPEMDGLTAATEIRKIDENVCFLLMSGCDPETIGKIGIAIESIPGSDFLRKPFSFSDMLRRIWRLASHHPE